MANIDLIMKNAYDKEQEEIAENKKKKDMEEFAYLYEEEQKKLNYIDANTDIELMKKAKNEKNEGIEDYANKTITKKDIDNSMDATDKAVKNLGLVIADDSLGKIKDILKKLLESYDKETIKSAMETLKTLSEDDIWKEKIQAIANQNDEKELSPTERSRVLEEVTNIVNAEIQSDNEKPQKIAPEDILSIYAIIGNIRAKESEANSNENQEHLSIMPIKSEADTTYDIINKMLDEIDSSISTSKALEEDEEEVNKVIGFGFGE